MDFHVRTENASTDPPPDLPLQPQAQSFVILSRNFGVCRTHERGSVPFSRICQKRKLTHHQDIPADLLNRTVHRAGFIRKNSEPADLAGQPIEFPIGITLLNAKKQQESGANFAYRLSFDADRCFLYALNNCLHIQRFISRLELTQAQFRAHRAKL
jgi:hypothetical protein